MPVLSKVLYVLNILFLFIVYVCVLCISMFVYVCTICNMCVSMRLDCCSDMVHKVVLTRLCYYCHQVVRTSVMGT